MSVVKSEFTANGTGSESTAARGGGVHIHVSGTFDGADVQIQFKDPTDGSNWLDIANATYTVASDDFIEFPDSGYTLRPVVTSAGGSTDLDVLIIS